MNCQKILDTTGTYTIQEHLMAMRSGFKASRLTTSLKDNILELKWNRNADAQRLVYRILESVSDSNVVGDVELIDDLLQMVNADKVIEGTPHTFDEYFNRESQGYE